MTKYWSWLLLGKRTKQGERRSPGIGHLINGWLIGHAVIGATLTFVSHKPLDQAAAAVLLPLAGVLIGLTFAWAASAQSILQSEEWEHISKIKPVEDYVYKYQTCIFIVLSALVFWGIAALGVFDQWRPEGPQANVIPPLWYHGASWALFASTSTAIRQCWQVVMAAQMSVIMKTEIKEALDREKQRAANDELRKLTALNEPPVHIPEQVTQEPQRMLRGK